MGFSISAVVIIFIAALMYIASIFYPLADLSYHRISQAEKDSTELMHEKLNSKIIITNWDSNNITVYNNGSITLNSSKINVIHNGTLESSFTVYPQGVWSPKTSINVDIGAATGRIKIITSNGAADYDFK